MAKDAPQRRIDSQGTQRAGSVIIAGVAPSGGGGGTDHGLLSGLGDDDHSAVYFNQARGDARYTLLANYNLHVGDPDAHHNRATAGNGLQISGQQLSVKLPTNSGLDTDASGLFITPDSISATTQSGVDHEFHTHYVEAAFDVSADGVGVETLLKSLAGGLTLGTLTVKGSIDITNGGDFTVGANTFFVDESQESVGILCAPDPQFALDINGPARATYWIGPHAIQLKDVLLLAHYDGRQPFATNYSGEPNGHMGQVATITGDVIYRPGMFGTKAVQLAEATQNLLPNPGAETNATGYGTDRVGATVSRVTDPVYIGTGAIYRTAGTSGSQNLYYSGAGALAGGTPHTYTFSAYLRALNGDDISASGIQMYLDSSAGGQTPTAIVSVGDGWYRFILTRTASSWGNAVVGFTNLPATAWYTDGWQLEEKAYATPYHSTGTSLQNPASDTRVATSLSYPIAGNVNAQRGTIMLWAKVDRFPSGGAGLWCAGDANTEFDAYLTAAGAVTFRINAATAVQAGTVAAGTWAHVAFTWDVAANQAKAYLDGAQVGSTGTVGGAPTLGTALYVGSLISAAVRLNGVLDDLVVLDRVLTATEILAVVESDAPVFAESSRFNFRATPQGLVWADDEGLWMRAVDGDPVLGVYGGAAATKSWGGWTDMASGDLMIGAYAGNHLRWDDSAGALIVSGQVTATTGAIGGWTLDTGRLYATNINLYSGVANTARVEAGSSSNMGGINSPNAAGDIVFWAGDTHANRASAKFKVTAAGALTSTSGAIGGWTIGATSLASSGGVGMYSGATAVTRIEVAVAGTGAGIAADTVAFWAGSVFANRATAPFRVEHGGDVIVKWLLGGDTGGKLSLRPAPYSASDFYLDLTSTENIFKIPSLQVGYGLVDETATLKIGGARNASGGDGISQIWLQSRAGVGSDFDARLYRDAGTNGVAQFTQRGTGAMQFYNFGDNDIMFYVNQVHHLNIDTPDGVRVTSSSFITLDERSTNPGNPTQDAQIRLYMKNNKIVFQYYGGNPVSARYLTFDMSASNTWSYGTSAP